MATRYYPLVKLPGSVIEGVGSGIWHHHGGGPSPHTPNSHTWLLAQSKIAGVGQTARTLSCSQQGNYDVPMLGRFISPPLQAQSIAGTFNLCFRVQARWLDGVLGFSNASIVRYKVHIYVTQGQSTRVRHLLLDNYVDPVNFPGTTGGVWRSLQSAQTLAAGSIEAGDSIIIEAGFRIVSSPLPSVTYPPDDWTQIDWTGTGASPSFVDAIAGDTSTSRAPWFEFSQTLLEQALPPAPDNDACVDALVIPSLPYTSPIINTTQSTDTNRRVWFTFTAPTTGEIFITTLGSNYRTAVDVFRGGCGALVFANFGSRVNYWAHRSGTVTLLNAVAGTQYWIRIGTNGNSECTNQGGALRLTAFYREAPQEDDLYMPAGLLVAYREGVPVNINAAVSEFTPLGVAIDYTQRAMTNIGGSPGGNPHVGERLVVGLFHAPNMAEILDLPTLSYNSGGGTDIDVVNDPWDLPVPQPNDAGCGIAQLYIPRATGVLHALWFGNGFLYVSGVGTNRPAYMNTVASQASFSALKVIDLANADNQPGFPFTDTEHLPTLEATSPWIGALDESSGVLYYASGSYYVPVGGQQIRTYNVTTASQGPLFATLPARPGFNPGVRGMCAIPGGGLLVCNGEVVHRLSTDGTIIGTYTPSLPEYSRTLMDVKLTAAGTHFWTVDLWTAQLFKVRLSDMTEVATYPTYMLPGTVLQMVLYQPNGITPPAPIVGAAACPQPVPTAVQGQSACPAPAPA
jgi:hypothetical protein